MEHPVLHIKMVSRPFPSRSSSGPLILKRTLERKRFLSLNGTSVYTSPSTKPPTKSSVESAPRLISSCPGQLVVVFAYLSRPLRRIASHLCARRRIVSRPCARCSICALY
ncbi:hypothetical protein AAC387_Pa04g0538 [Persea americana]